LGIILIESGLNALMTYEPLTGYSLIIGRYSTPYACHTPTLRVPFPLPLERETYAKGTRMVGETYAKPLMYVQCIWVNSILYPLIMLSGSFECPFIKLA